MTNTTRELFLKPVLEAMQHAEEIGGPEGAEYEELMGAIASEANKRRQAFLENPS